MPDIGWMELLVIGIVALIVVGPKDLPMMFRKLGQFTGRVRGMAKDFQRAMDEAADEAGMSDINRDLRKATDFVRNPKKAGMNAFKDSLGEDLELDSVFEGDGPAPGTAPGATPRKAGAEQAKTAVQLREEAAARRQARIDEAIAAKQAASPPQPATATSAATPDTPPGPDRS